MPAAPVTPPPPDPPELPPGAERRPRWSARLGALGFAIGPGPLLLLAGLASLGGGTAGGESESADVSSTVIVVASLVQGLWFVGVALLLASLVARPRAWHFGLRATRLWPALGWAAVGMLCFYFVTAIYSLAVQPDAEQGTVEALGADEGTLGLFLAGATVIAVAPVVEEIFFRGFFYRALRSRFGIAGAATIDGVLFGLIHFGFDGADGLLLLPPLALLGAIFCLVYERTGSLLPVIGMHAFNNMIAYAAQAESGWIVAVTVGPLVLAGCALVPRMLSGAWARAPAPA